MAEKRTIAAKGTRHGQKSAEQGSGDGDGGGSDSDDSSVDGLALTPDANAVGTKIDGNGDLVAIGTGTGAVAPACDGPAPDGEGHRATFLGAQAEKAHTFLGADGTNRKGHHFDTSSARASDDGALSSLHATSTLPACAGPTGLARLPRVQLYQ